MTPNKENSLEGRIERLEKAVFGKERTTEPSIAKNIKAKTNKTDFTGPKGGVLLLKERGFLKTPKSTNEIKAEMEKHDFYYKREVIQTALNRLTGPQKPLTAMEKSGKKAYVIRK